MRHFTKTTRIARPLFSLLVVLAACSALQADIFMELGDVPGESKERNHENWIVCEGIEFGVQQAESAPTAGKTVPSGNARFTEITLKRQLDVSSPDLFVSAADGGSLGEATIELTNATGDVFLRIALRSASIKSYSVKLADGKLFEEIKVTYTMITMTYIAMGEDGKSVENLTRAWDVAANIER